MNQINLPLLIVIGIDLCGFAYLLTKSLQAYGVV